MRSGALTVSGPTTIWSPEGSRLCLPADKERGSSEEQVDAGARPQPAGMSNSPAQHPSPGLTSDSAPVGARQPQTSGTGPGGQPKRTASGELESRNGIFQSLWLLSIQAVSCPGLPVLGVQWQVNVTAL